MAERYKEIKLQHNHKTEPLAPDVQIVPFPRFSSLCLQSLIMEYKFILLFFFVCSAYSSSAA